MATEILRPQDCLARRMGASFPAAAAAAAAAYPRQRSCGYGSSCSNPRPNRKHHQHQHQQRKPAASERSSPYEAGEARPGGGGLLAMGKVTILRRGEPLDATARDDDAGSKREGGGPEPEMARKQVGAPELRSPAAGRAVVYAGSAFAVSPEPSSLPLPSFSKKKQVLLVDDSATRDLRKLLRLDLL